jgi:hypothetical protein
MALSMDANHRQQREYMCPCCQAPIQRTSNVVNRDGTMAALYFASSYHHRDQPHETWIDAILGTWDGDDVSDHVTFGCRVGPIEGQEEPAATLVEACLDGSGGPVHGQLLSREAGLAHPRLAEFWQVVDFVLAEDPVVNRHLYAASQP